MTQPAVEGEWSVKDLLAHFAAWTQHLARLLDAASRGETPERWDDIDRMNAHIFAENRDRPLRDVLSDFHESYRRVLRAGNTHGR